MFSELDTHLGQPSEFLSVQPEFGKFQVCLRRQSLQSILSDAGWGEKVGSLTSFFASSSAFRVA